MVEPDVDHLVGWVTGRWIRWHVAAFLGWAKLRSRRDAIGEPALYTVMAEIDEPLRLHRQARCSGAEAKSQAQPICSYHP